MRTTKTRTRSSGALLRRASRLTFAGILAALSCVAAQRKQPKPHATVAGTVFRDPGFALPGATVVLIRKDDPKAKKLAQTLTNDRGEFSFEVPPDTATYIVKASRKGFQPEQKEATVSVGERIEVTLSLSQESK